MGARRCGSLSSDVQSHHQGGDIHTACGRITVRATDERGDVVIRVRDTGIGIATDVLPKVFDLFVQERQDIDRPHGGLGLGLTIVRNLVERHGGTVSAHSDGPGMGSEFVVRLPRADTPAALGQPPT
jgi:signal transduction histidine kinase